MRVATRPLVSLEGTLVLFITKCLTVHWTDSRLNRLLRTVPAAGEEVEEDTEAALRASAPTAVRRRTTALRRATRSTGFVPTPRVLAKRATPWTTAGPGRVKNVRQLRERRRAAEKRRRRRRKASRTSPAPRATTTRSRDAQVLCP